MRLAEFKTNLFIFFAGRLRKWAASVDQEIITGQRPPVTPVDHSSEVRLAESSRESGAASGPPEHWARLVATAPPQHWLDLIRQKAPQLLSPPSQDRASLPASEGIGQTSKPETGDSEDVLSVQNEAAENSQRLPPRPARPGSQRTRDAATTAARRTWLNRLRFQPPRQRTTEDPEQQFTQSSTAAASQAVAGSESSDSRGLLRQTADKESVRRNTSLVQPETSPRYSGNDESGRPGVSRNSSSGTLVDAAGARAAGNETAHLQAAKSTWRQTVLRWVNRYRQIAGVDVSQVRQDQPALSSPLLNVNRPDREQRSTLFTDSDRVTPEAARWRAARLFEESNGNERDTGASRAGSTKESEGGRAAAASREAGIAARSKQSYPVTAKNRSIVYEPLFSSALPVAAEESASNFFSVERTAASLIESWTNSSPKPGGSAWPSLPPAPTFNFADELAAIECEGEVSRRLDQEQRGTLWNA